MMNETSVPVTGAKSSSVGLVCHYLFSNSSAQYTFLRLSKNGGVVLMHRQFGFSSHKNLHICASSNGLLLLSDARENQLCYHVYDPITKQCAALPKLLNTRKMIKSGLAFDGHNYLVVRFFYDDTHKQLRNPNGLEMEIFSSESGKWRQHWAHILQPHPVPTKLSRLDTPPLFANDALHWDLSGYLLIYHIKDDYCEFIQLPTYTEKWSWKSMTFGQCLWQSAGRVHYCYSDNEGVHTWALLTEEERNYFCSYYVHGYDRDKFRWRLAHSLFHRALISRYPENFLSLDDSREHLFIAPCAFLEDLKKLYLRVPGSVVSYDLKSQTFEKICTFTFRNNNLYSCTFYPFVYNREGEGRPLYEEPTLVNLPVEDISQN